MRTETRVQFDAYCEAIAKLNGVPSATKKFAVSPSVQQTLEDRIQESSDFLKLINMIGVSEQTGAKLGLGVGSPIASTTDTTAKDRQTSDVTDLDENGYNCTQTNFDTHLTYAKLDAWAKFKDFQTRIRNAIVRRQALDRIAIGFNGRSRAATSDRAANPLLQDVNKGWLQRMRDQAPQRVMDEGTKTAGKIIVGANGDYANLDALVADLLASMIDPWHQDDTALVVLCGRGLLHDKYFPLINKTQAPSEMLAADVIQSQKRIGGLPAAAVPFFPANAVMITSYDNLSIYFQDGARRRTIEDNAKRDRVENYESSNDAYVVEDLGRAAVAENIEIAPAA
ncbi:TPA: phage major capsid protein, P2 family [Burkholderia vietnamiensis]|nr:phage major capsid protein, P2 family [Burkholderia vietnamiensis]